MGVPAGMEGPSADSGARSQYRVVSAFALCSGWSEEIREGTMSGPQPPPGPGTITGRWDAALSGWTSPLGIGQEIWHTHTQNVFPKHLRFYKCQLFQNILRFTKSEGAGGGLGEAPSH